MNREFPYEFPPANSVGRCDVVSLPRHRLFASLFWAVNNRDQRIFVHPGVDPYSLPIIASAPIWPTVSVFQKGWNVSDGWLLQS